MKQVSNLPGRMFMFVVIAAIILGSILEFYNISAGTGNWLGIFSIKWGVIFLFFLLLFAILLFGAGAILWGAKPPRFFEWISHLRDRMGAARWPVALMAMFFMVWLLQYSVLGIILKGPAIRVLIWGITVLVCGFILTKSPGSLVDYSTLCLSVLLTCAFINLSLLQENVTNHPFSLGWSEGNRMWDYSLMFGSRLYHYSTDNPPIAYLDFGRQLSGGLPFLLPNLTIAQERFWLNLMGIVPYVLLGWIAFRLPGSGSRPFTFLAGLWAWMYLKQGPIHVPLLWSAMLVALAWTSRLWMAVPLVAFSAYIATTSRYTWVFAPAIWSAMLELGSGRLVRNHLSTNTWKRAIIMVLAGLAGGVLIPNLMNIWAWVQGGETSISLGQGVNVANLSNKVADQPLLWYRLLPNATYGTGILLGLLIVVVPLIIVLVYLCASRIWVLNSWQRLAIVFPLLAFLAVGLIASTKIGGGGDLHNMDMFLIGVMFSVVLSWRGGGVEWMRTMTRSPAWMRAVMLVMIASLGYGRLMNLRPISYTGDIEWLAKLVDVPMPVAPPSRQSEELLRALGLLPSDELTNSTLELIREQVREAQKKGEVLFIDQRQLLTFGYVQDVPLVWQYEKKWMMDKALSGDGAYFESFYRDLAAHRFSLIISDPLRTPIKDSEYQFGEENNAWVKWVALPILCYYEPMETIKYVRVQLLVPAGSGSDCLEALP